jgi:hypothetical protein
LFAGRPDVFPARWENRRTGRAGYSPACFNEWEKGICGKPKVKCGECPHQAFIPLSDEIIEQHLRGGDARSGDFVAGVYPLLQDETCWFLAADFDQEAWAEDAGALLKTCQSRGIHRRHAGKADVLVVDYVDSGVPVLTRMAAKRRAGYRTLGYAIE